MKSKAKEKMFGWKVTSSEKVALFCLVSIFKFLSEKKLFVQESFCGKMFWLVQCRSQNSNPRVALHWAVFHKQASNYFPFYWKILSFSCQARLANLRLTVLLGLKWGFALEDDLWPPVLFLLRPYNGCKSLGSIVKMDMKDSLVISLYVHMFALFR